MAGMALDDWHISKHNKGPCPHVAYTVADGDKTNFLLCQACSFFEGIKFYEKRSTWRKLV